MGRSVEPGRRRALLDGAPERVGVDRQHLHAGQDPEEDEVGGAGRSDLPGEGGGVDLGHLPGGGPDRAEDALHRRVAFAPLGEG